MRVSASFLGNGTGSLETKKDLVILYGTQLVFLGADVWLLSSALPQKFRVRVCTLGRWINFTVGGWNVKFSVGTGTGSSGGSRGGDKTPLLVFGNWVSALFNHISDRGFILLAGGSFLTGPQYFGGEPFKDFRGGSGQGCLILRPSTSRWTPTCFGTSTAGWRSKVTLKYFISPS